MSPVYIIFSDHCEDGLYGYDCVYVPCWVWVLWVVGIWGGTESGGRSQRSVGFFLADPRMPMGRLDAKAWNHLCLWGTDRNNITLKDQRKPRGADQKYGNRMRGRGRSSAPRYIQVFLLPVNFGICRIQNTSRA